MRGVSYEKLRINERIVGPRSFESEHFYRQENIKYLCIDTVTLFWRNYYSHCNGSDQGTGTEDMIAHIDTG